jgi:uncharacterized membrane protein (UPF0127 family)
MIKRLVIVICSTLVLSACNTNTFDISKYQTTTLKLEQTEITLAIADTPELQAKGFMNIQKIPANQGMIFTYSEEKLRSFWMKNTYIPLDIIFLNQNLEIINISHNTPPCINSDPTQTNCPSYKSTSPAQYTIELPSPQAKELNLETDQQLIIQL